MTFFCDPHNNEQNHCFRHHIGRRQKTFQQSEKKLNFRLIIFSWSFQFRRSVSDILRPEHDDHFLLRWLRARQWNPDNAEKMLREVKTSRLNLMQFFIELVSLQSLKWREKWGVDDIESWESPAVFKDFIPHGTTGFDKEGSPIILIPFAGIDIWGILHSASKHDIIKNTIKLLERELF